MHFTCFDRQPRKPPLFQLRCECEDGCVAVIYAPLRRACQLLPRAAFSFHFFFLAAFFLFFFQEAAGIQPSNRPRTILQRFLYYLGTFVAYLLLLFGVEAGH